MSCVCDRRGFLRITLAAGGALLAGWRPALAAPPPADLPLELIGDALVELGPFIRIERDGRVIIGASGCETGQGVRTAWPMLVAEELDVDWARVTVVQLPFGETAAPGEAGRPLGRQGGLPTDPAADWHALREAGAVVRQVLMAAAAQDWQIPLEALATHDGEVVAPDGRRLAYAALAERAALLPLPPHAPLRAEADFRLVGQPTRTADARAIVTGAARFGSDAVVADLLVAAIARCPFQGGSLASHDDSASRRIAGVRDVLVLPETVPGALPGGVVLPASVAVLADTTWAALRARGELALRWERAADAPGAATLAASAHALLGSEEGSLTVRSDGDPAEAQRQAARSIRARYELPFLAHATMEPPAALVDLRGGRAHVEGSLEDPAGAAALIAQATGLSRDTIDIALPRSGGSFGRRLRNDHVAEALRLAQLAGKPVKVLWTRGDDLAHDSYRPFGVHALAAALDQRGRITGWSHRCAATPRGVATPGGRTPPPNAGCLEFDQFPAGLVANLEYRFFPLASPLPVDPGDHAATAFACFATESFLDEVAHASRQDALQLRLDLLANWSGPPAAPAGRPGFDGTRLAHVLRRCAERLGWGVRRSDGHGLGLACHAEGGSYLAHGFEASVQGNRLILHRAICVADIGRIVNPLGSEANLAGATLATVSDTLHGAITLADGRVRQRDFADYRLLTMAQAPRRVEVEIVASGEAPTIAPPWSAPGAAPALANAVFAATTVRVRKLPLYPELMRLI